MDIQGLIKNLHPLEVRVLLTYTAQDELTSARLQKELGYKEGHANQAFSWLSGKDLVQVVSRKPHTYYELTELGTVFRTEGQPAQRIFNCVKEKGALSLPKIAAQLHLENKDVGSAFGMLSKEGVLALNDDKKAVVKSPDLPESVKRMASLIEKAYEAENRLLDQETLSAEEIKIIASGAKKRGASDAAFRIVERETVVYALTKDAASVCAALKQAGITGTEIGALSPKLLAAGEWKNANFRSYNISIPPARIIPGRANAYVSFLESVKDKLASLGFEEFDGPLVETEFWNSDALFMPQFHAARDIHDVYYIKNPQYAKK